MKLTEAIDLIRPAVSAEADGPGVWADFGSGRGTFTRALAVILGPEGRVIGVDLDPKALQALRMWADADGEPRAEIETVRGDFRRIDAIGALAGRRLDGALFANALHFVSNPTPILSEVARRLEPTGRLVVVEYDDRPADAWVPHPVSLDRLRSLAAQAGFGAPQVIGQRPSRYGGVMYCALLRRV